MKKKINSAKYKEAQTTSIHKHKTSQYDESKFKTVDTIDDEGVKQFDNEIKQLSSRNKKELYFDDRYNDSMMKGSIISRASSTYRKRKVNNPGQCSRCIIF